MKQIFATVMAACSSDFLFLEGEGIPAPYPDLAETLGDFQPD